VEEIDKEAIEDSEEEGTDESKDCSEKEEFDLEGKQNKPQFEVHIFFFFRSSVNSFYQYSIEKSALRELWNDMVNNLCDLKARDSILLLKERWCDIIKMVWIEAHGAMYCGDLNMLEREVLFFFSFSNLF